MDKKQVKAIADTEANKAVSRHQKEMHGSRGIGLLKPSAEKKMAKGGVTGEAMRKYGRNLARAMNQRGTSRGK